ncbi:MAG: sulfurtransferase TusA family protein [Bacillales bacterium]
MASDKPIIIDARGAFCPGPLMELMKAARGAEPGTVFHLLTNEEGSRKDVPAWVRKMGHEFLGEEPGDGTYYKLKVKIK